VNDLLYEKPYQMQQAWWDHSYEDPHWICTSRIGCLEKVGHDHQENHYEKSQLVIRGKMVWAN